MKKVYNKIELENALRCGEKRIVIYGDLAKKIRNKKNVNNVAKVGGAILALSSILFIPLSGGMSALAGAGIAATASVSTISISELALLCGFTIAIYGASKGYNVKFNRDGSVTLIKK